MKRLYKKLLLVPEHTWAEQRTYVSQAVGCLSGAIDFDGMSLESLDALDRRQQHESNDSGRSKKSN